jgi:hypothetical protein
MNGIGTASCIFFGYEESGESNLWFCISLYSTCDGHNASRIVFIKDEIQNTQF